MRKNLTIWITATILFAALVIPVRLAAQDQAESQAQNHKHSRYKVVDLGTLGGPSSGGNEGSPSLNNHGMAVGYSQTLIPFSPNSNDFPCAQGVGFQFVPHAFEWRNGVLTDLGALPGPGKCSNAGSINERGDAVGNSEIDEIDPVLGLFAIRAVLWKDGHIIDLGTLEGGTESAAIGINNREQVVGISINDTPDPYSFFVPFGQTRAFLWERGVMRDLGTLGGPDAQALVVNDRGQVTGFSYTNSVPNTTTGIPTVDPFLWENGQMLDLGTLGGTIAAPDSLNKRGQVVGFSTLAGDSTQHPFLWDRGVLRDLGTFGGDNGQANWINDAGAVVGVADLPDGSHDAFLWKHGVMTDLGNLGATSGAQWINSQGQVVGASRIDAVPGNARAFLWENGGPIVDLNTLIPHNSGLTLVQAFSINDRGEIYGIGVPPGVPAPDWEFSGHAYVLIPCHDGDGDGCKDRAETTTVMTQSTPGAASQAPTARTQSRPAPNERVASFRGRWINRHQVPGAGARD